MKSLKFLALAGLMAFAVSCEDTKKKEQEQVDKAVKTIDSVETAIEESAETLKNVADDVHDAVKELDSI
ncbi:hypothetical protein MQE36_13995 [Zhouia spongiae]|uniref:Lipoprotein n=1 Tax=Zhouia spongiae TaxID=2202721 RepID=A0ABY3YK18_9FLAO|nr:hypothetical protein [Zhouia spongiae]UNY98190.1 hypothetical protein MQE36_13995 [Zhouia spongiae]